MFRFHETTRKRITRWAFVLLCGGPTLATIAWIACRHRPGVVRSEALRLGGVLRVDVRLSDWRQPRPGVARTSGMTLIEPGANVTLADFEAVEIQRFAKWTRIAAAGATLDVGHVDALHRRVCAWLAAIEGDAVRIEIDALTIRSASAKTSFALRDVQIRVDPRATGGIKAQLTAHTPAHGGSDPELRVVVEQIPGEDKGAIRATVDARHAPLPAWVIATTAPLFAACGEDSTFSGVLQLEVAGGTLRGIAHGQIDAISLGSLLPSGSPHAAAGQGSATIADMHWRDRQIETLIGSARATNFNLSKSLIDAAVASLFCGQTRAGVAPETVLVDALACRFQLNNRGLTLSGELGPESNLPTGCLIASEGRPLLMQPPYVDIPPGAWVQFLAGPALSWVPASQEAVDMAKRLPLPK